MTELADVLGDRHAVEAGEPRAHLRRGIGDRDEVGPRVGALPFVSHCYRRPRQPPLWPYNLFAMVHGRGKDEVEEKVAAIARLLGPDDRGHAVLYSTRILKKTGLRLA